MIGDLASGLAIVEGFKQLYSSFSKQAKAASKGVDIENNILQAAKAYPTKYADRHGQAALSLPGLRKEMSPLEAIYTTVKFLDESSVRYFSTLSAIEETYRQRGKRSFRVNSQPYDETNIVEETQYLMVLGGPGVGKSTFLRKLGLDALKVEKGQQKIEKIPVFIELGRCRDKDIDLLTLIASEFRIFGFPNAEDLARLKLHKGKLLILLDGLDEVPTDNIDRVAEHIKDFKAEYSDNKFVISCRTAAYHDSFQRFTNVTISDFDDKQIEQFIQQWFRSESGDSSRADNLCHQLLEVPNNIAIKELSHTPLLLTFLCLVYEKDGALPSTRSVLYGKALDIILKEWTSQKTTRCSSINKNFTATLEKGLLSKLAYQNFAEDKLFFSKTDIISDISDFLRSDLNASKNLNEDEILTAIEIEQGILIKQAGDTYSFSHLTLQEYLTALYLSENVCVQELVIQHVCDNRWREVFMLVSGLMGSQGYELLEAIEKQARCYIADQPKLIRLMQWAQEVTSDSLGMGKAFEKRATAIAIVSSFAAVRNGPPIKMTSEFLEISKSSAVVNSSIGTITETDINAQVIATVKNSRLISYGLPAVEFRCSVEKAIDSSMENVSHLIALKHLRLERLEKLYRQLQEFKEVLPQIDVTVSDWSRYAESLVSSWIEAFDLSDVLVSLSVQEWQSLADYIYASELLFLCQRSSSDIPASNHYKIEQRLLSI